MRSKLFFAVPVAALFLSACAEGEDPLMPDVVGIQLDAAIAHLDNAGIDSEPELDGGGLFGVIDESAWVVCAQVPAAGAPAPGTPLLTVDRECGGDEATVAPSATPSEDSTSGPSPEATAEAEPDTEAAEYEYVGPEYEILQSDIGAGMGAIDLYWVLTDAVDAASDSYQDAIKAIITDVAYEKQSATVLVYVVSDAEIVEAESINTQADFMATHDSDYWSDVMIPKEAEHWIASYSGGIDYNLGELSDADEAFEILWWPYGDVEIEQWKPAVSTP